MARKFLSIILFLFLFCSIGMCLRFYAQGKLINSSIQEWAELVQNDEANDKAAPEKEESLESQIFEDTTTAAVTAAISIDIWKELEKMSGSIDMMVNQINDLLELGKDETATEDQIPMQFNSFKQEFKNVVAQADLFSEAAENVRSKGEIYFEEWGKKLESIQSPTLRNRGERKRDKKLKNFAGFNESIQETQEELGQFMTGVQDIIHYLHFNLRLKSVNSVSSDLRKAERNASKIQKEIGKTEKILTELALLPEIMSYKQK